MNEKYNGLEQCMTKNTKNEVPTSYESISIHINRGEKQNHDEKTYEQHVHKTGKNKHTEQLGKETCFFVLSSSSMPSPVTEVTTSCRLPPITTLHRTNVFTDNYSTLYHSCETIGQDVFTHVHIPKETSLSSGVASGESSELSLDIPMMNNIRTDKSHVVLVDDCDLDYSDSASPLAGKNVQVHVCEKDFENFVISGNNHMEFNPKQFHAKSTQTDHAISCPCPCSGAIQRRNYVGNKITSLDDSVKSRIVLNSPIDSSSRRDSGYSSISHTPVSPRQMDFSLSSINENQPTDAFDKSKEFDSIKVIVQSDNRPLKQQYDEAKERYLNSIKRSNIDPGKELMLVELKKHILKAKLKSLSTEKASEIWQPIKPKVLLPLRSVLKNNGAEREQTNKYTVGSSIKRKSPVTAKEVLDIISQVRQCLDIVKKMKPAPEKSIQVHQRIKLKSFCPSSSKNSRPDITQNSQTRICDESSDKQNCFPCGRKQKNMIDKKSVPYNTHELLHSSAKNGDIRNILELMHDNEVDINKKDSSGWPPIHHAFQNKHYRTAILLLESSANIKEYTEQKVNEYKAAVEIVNKNKLLLKS